MTDVLHVRRMHVSYRLERRSGAETRARLDSILDRVLEESLEPALTRNGVRGDEEVCVRFVRAPARLRLAAGDAAAAAAWSSAIADAVAAAVAAGGKDVVRYRSRRAALVDFAVSVAAGRTARAWAWRRLGLWRAATSDDPAAGARELVAALERDAPAIVPVLGAVARAGSLARLAAALEADEWTALARAALAAAGVRGPTLDAALDVLAPESGRRRAEDEDASRPAASEVARRVAERAPLAVAARGAAAATRAPQVAVAIAALAWLEHDAAAPAAASVARAGAIVAAVADALRTSSIDVLASDDESAGASARDEGAAPHADAAEGRPADRLPTNDSEPAVDEPRRATSRYAGLLFLLGVLDVLGVPGAATGESPLARRPLRWALHRLALVLAPVERDDPAALAFAGLAPDDEPPADDDVPSTDDERDALRAFARSIVDHLRERLELADATPDDLVELVTRRRGEIVFDPGWIEVRLPLAEVSVDLRRAGLDLDAGWLPWLGAVVKVTYV